MPSDRRQQKVVVVGQVVDQFLVEVIAGTTKPNTAVIGRHYRVVVSEDGARVKKVVPLSKDALEMPTNNCPNQAKCPALVMNQIVTDTPVETHVLVSLQHKVDLFVLTSRGWWRVKGAKIDFLGSLDDKKEK